MFDNISHCKRMVLRLTFVDDWFFLPEVGESGEGLDTIVLGESLVVNFDKIHTECVRVVINLFEFFQHFVACYTASRICKQTGTHYFHVRGNYIRNIES